MICKIQDIEPLSVASFAYSDDSQNFDPPFRLCSLDTNTYIGALTIQSGINLRRKDNCHCVQMGKFCSLAEDITLMIDLNHPYHNVIQGVPYFLPEQNGGLTGVSRKGSILLQNDVWIGHGATVMAGVTLHNGCVVAANAVVTKDVPPYAIVGGNPAKVIKYRFPPDIIAGLQKIAYWDWMPQQWEERADDFRLPVDKFVEKYLPEAEDRLKKVQPVLAGQGQKVILFVPDISEHYALYPQVLRQFCSVDRPNCELLLYVPGVLSSSENIERLEAILGEYETCDCSVILQTGVDLDEHLLMSSADYYVTTRNEKNIYRTCLADLYGTQILYGTDHPIFPEDLV